MRESRRAGLPCAEQFAFAAQLQILLGNEETVLRLPHDLKPGLAVSPSWPL